MRSIGIKTILQVYKKGILNEFKPMKNMKKVNVFGHIVLLILSGLFFSGCSWDDLWSGDDDGVDCGEVFCLGTLLAESESFNRHLREAVELAKEDIKNAGEDIEIISEDFRAGEEEAEASAMRLHEIGVHAVVGPSFSSDAINVFDFISKNKIVTISPSATSPEITKRNKALVDGREQNYFFRLAPSDLFQAPILAGEITGSNVVVVYRDDAWGQGLFIPVKENLESAGKTVKEVKYSPKEDEFPGAEKVVEMVEMLDEIENTDSIVALVFSEGKKIIKGLLASDTIPDETKYYVGDGFLLNDGFFPLGDKEKEGAMGGFTNITSSPLPEKRLAEFKERFSDDAESVSSFAAHAYDATVILHLAALAAGSTEPANYVQEIEKVSESGTECYTYATCAAALTDGTETNDDINYQGLSGPIAFNNYGDIKSGFYAVYTYDREGKSSVEYVDFDGKSVSTGTN